MARVSILLLALLSAGSLAERTNSVAPSKSVTRIAGPTTLSTVVFGSGLDAQVSGFRGPAVRAAAEDDDDDDDDDDSDDSGSSEDSDDSTESTTSEQSETTSTKSSSTKSSKTTSTKTTKTSSKTTSTSEGDSDEETTSTKTTKTSSKTTSTSEGDSDSETTSTKTSKTSSKTTATSAEGDSDEESTTTSSTAKTSTDTSAVTTSAGDASATTAGSDSGSGSGSTNTELQTSFPTASSTTGLSAVQTIAAGDSFDGGMVQFDRSPSTCSDQSEGGDSDAVFILEDGATLSNVLIGPDNGEGVHCLGACTLNNVWWVDVCEDAATFKQDEGSTSYVNGGGAKSASDKVLQHNGGGTLAVKNFYATGIGKLYRSCGNCDTQYARTSTFDNVRLEDAKVLGGINSNLGDKITISDSCVLDASICYEYEGNDSGDEPTKVASEPDGTYCIATNVETSGC